MTACRIDAHQHYWQLARGDYAWLTPALAAIHRDFGPQDLAPALDRAGIAGTVLVQAQRHPELRIVIDHGAKPAIRDDAFEPWATAIRDVAGHAACLCKLSGLATDAGPGWTAAVMQRYVDHLLDAFGPRRLMWGSDWPVVYLASDYERWLSACESMLGALPDTERPAIFGGNAIDFCRLAPVTIDRAT